MKIEKFKSWLIQNGADVLPCTNDFEAIRFKGKQVGVVYKSGKFSNEYAKIAYEAYKNGRNWDGRPLKVGRKNSYKKEKISIQKRDGSNCFYCGCPLNDDITLEHLIPLTSGGKNVLQNMVLAHEKCNGELGNLPLIDKVNKAIELRVGISNNNKK